MNISEAGKVLTFASAGDNRAVTKEAALIWAEALDADITTDDARRAITSHFANSVDYLRPVHVNTIVRGWRVARSRELPPVVPPRELADDRPREIQWERVWGDAFLAGHTEDQSRIIANRRFGIDDTEPLAIEPPSGLLRETLDRTAREMADKNRMAEIQAEVDRQAKAKKREAQIEAEKSRASHVSTEQEASA